MNPTGAGVGSIFVGLLIVLGLAAVVYLVGVWAVANLRRGRVEEETTTAFPAQPQGEDDRREVEQVRERAVGAAAATEMAAREQSASGRPMRVVSQTPDSSGERPVDADHDRGVAPRAPGGDSEQRGGDRSPL